MRRAAVVLLALACHAPTAPAPVCERTVLRIPYRYPNGRDTVLLGTMVYCPPGARDTVDVGLSPETGHVVAQ